MSIQAKLAISLLIVVFATGCPRNQYIIEMTPARDSIERKLTCWREDGGDTNGIPNFVEFPREDLLALKTLFNQHEIIGRKHQFSSRFTGTLPDDVGGRGSYTTFETSLGTSFVYVERFRGQDDLHLVMEHRLKAVDELVDLLTGWIKSELSAQPGYHSLREFLETDFRKDMRNLALYFWIGGFAEGNKSGGLEEPLVRIGQYLAERDYWSIKDLPAVVASDRDLKPLLVLLRRLVAAKTGVKPDQAIPDALAFLSDPDRLEKSFSKYLRATPQFAASLKEWETRKEKPTDDGPDPLEIPNGLIGQIIQTSAGEGGDQLTVKLALPSAPSYTNGKWDEKAQHVLWERNLEPQRGPFQGMPAICYAEWSVPQEQKQRDCFGKTILKGEDLLQYCLLYKNLGPAELAKWDALISSLRPVDAKQQVERFRFSDMNEPSNASERSHPEIQQLLLRLLTD
jgi:hypothetical protein